MADHERGDDMVKRLRGIYTVPVNDGAGPLNGSNEFTRAFDVPPIQREAADEIERLRAENAAIRTVADEAELNREGIKAAHADLRKLRARIEAAPVGELVASHAHTGDFAIDAGHGVPVDISALVGKRVRLVVDGAGEGG